MREIFFNNSNSTNNCVTGRFYTGRPLFWSVPSVLISNNNLSVLLFTRPSRFQ